MWRNWAGNQAMAPAVVERPASTEQVTDVVSRATAAGRRVKAIGSGHSFTGIGLTDGVLLDLSRLSGVLAVDRDAHRVTVGAGTTLRRLNADLAALGLGLTNMGDVDRQTAAGAISTGTHGTGRSSGAIATQVVALELVLADGSVVTCSPSSHSGLFSAARVALGALGVLTAVTLQAEPAFLLRAVERPRPLEEVLDGFDDFVAAHDHAEFFWFPHTDVALTKANDRVDGPAAPLPRPRALLEDEVLGNGVFGAVCRLGAARPALVPRLNRVAARTMGERTYTAPAPDVFTSPRRVRFREMEYAVPRADLVPVVRELRGLPERERLRVSFPVEVRVAPADDVPLSTASGRDTAYVAVHVYAGEAAPRAGGLDPWLATAERVVDAVGGRPHWGKLHSQDASTLRPRYPGFDAFLALRDRLDPAGAFSNAYLDRVLGPVRG
jgi:FAD-linked oxidoreductase